MTHLVKKTTGFWNNPLSFPFLLAAILMLPFWEWLESLFDGLDA